MAFHEWINAESKGTSCLSEQDFANLSQRELGFQAGQTASARNVNSALRQANLVAVALMESLNVDGSLQSTKDVLKTNITDALNSNLRYIKLSGSIANGDITGDLVSRYNTNLGNPNRRWNNLYCQDVNYNGTFLSEQITHINTKINESNAVKYYKMDIANFLPSHQGDNVGYINFVKSKNMVCATIYINVGSTSMETNTSYVLAYMYDTDANLGKYFPSQVYNIGNPFMLGELVRINNATHKNSNVFFSFVNTNYALLKINSTEQAGEYMAQVMWFTDN